MFLVNIMSQDNVTSKKMKRDQEENRRDDVSAREKVSRKSTRMDLGPIPN